MVPHRGDRSLEAASVPDERPEGGRQKHETQQEQPPVDVQQDRDRPRQVDQAPYPPQRQLGGDALQFAGVRIDA